MKHGLFLSFVVSLMLSGAAMPGEEPVPVSYDPAPVERIMDKDVNGWIEHLKTYENEQQRLLAIYCLSEFGPAAAGAVDELRRLFKADAQPDVQRFACVVLGTIGPAAKAAIPDLFAVVNSSSAHNARRAAALGALAQIDPESATVQRAVAAALHDRSHEVRSEAINASVTLSAYDNSTVATLSRMLASGDAPAVCAALRCLGDPGIDALINGVGMERGDANTRRECADALGRSGKVAARALPALVRAAQMERDPSARLILTAAATRFSPRDPVVLDILAQRLALPERDAMPEDWAGSVDWNFPRAAYEFETKLLIAAGEKAAAALRHGLQTRDAAARVRLVNILAKIAPPPADAVGDLIARAQDVDPNVRVAAAKALDAYGPVAVLAKEALERMAAGEPEGTPAQRVAALAAANVSRPADHARYKWAIEPYSNEQLLSALKDRRAWLRQEAAEALRARSDQEGGGAIATALIEALKDSDPHVQTAAARSLVHFGKQSPAAMDTFLKWLENDDLALRRAALVALAGMGEAAKPALSAIVKTAAAPAADTDKELQTTLSVVLRVIGPDAVTALTAELKKPDAIIRARAARALSSMGEVALTAIPDLIELSKSAVDSDAEAGLDALGAMGPPAYALAGTHLATVVTTDLFVERRRSAALALGEIGVPADGDKLHVIDALLKALLDEDASVCRAAHGAMVRIGNVALSLLRDTLKLGVGDAPYWALRVLARLKADPSDVIPKLFDYAQPGKLPVERGVVLELLGNYAPGHPEIIPVLLRGLSDREEFVAHAAMRSLAPFGDAAMPSLTKLLKQRNPLLRRRALDAITVLQAAGN